ncbi:MAG TPA: hypothetical protein VE913_20455, partial [Longimicrobium sp.]|nr:hypothetical protein [Longimicrobium sp.]
MSRTRMRFALLGALLLTSAACQDNPVGPSPVQTPSSPNLARVAENRGHGSGVCYLARRALASPLGLEARTVNVEFPRSEVAPDGRTRDYRYRGYITAGQLVATGDCTIPDTEKAVQHIDRLFGIKRNAENGGDLGGVSILGCVSDGYCEIEGITANGCVGGGDWPNCNGIMQPSDLPQCSMYNECGGGTWTPGPLGGGGGGGGGDGSAGAMNEGIVAWAVCVLAMGGSAYSVWDVSDEFSNWYDAYRAAQRAYRMWRVTVENNADPAIQQLYEYMYDQARLRQEDARGDVSKATDMSAIALAGAALACG